MTEIVLAVLGEENIRANMAEILCNYLFLIMSLHKNMIWAC